MAMRKWQAVLDFSVVVASICVVLDIFRWQLVNVLTVFLEPFIEIAATLALLVALIRSLVALFAQWRQHSIEGRVVWAVAICFVALAVRIFAPFDALMLRADFRIYLKRRTQIASEVVAGKWENKAVQKGGRGEAIKLPESDQSLSDDGDVLLWREGGQSAVLFMSFRGVLDSFSGFVYTTDDRPPPADAFLGDPAQVERWSSHWYWYASQN
jgi:hypothetical protein